MSSFDVVIVGGGILGTSSAYCLSRHGCKVLLLDQFDVPNAWSASGDHARILCCTHGSDLFRSDLAAQSLAMWRNWQKDLKEELFLQTGMLDLAGKESRYEDACFNSLKELKLPVEKLGQDEIKERYRVFNPRAARFAVYHPDAGMIWARRAVTAFAAAAGRRHAVIHGNTKIVSISRDSRGIKDIRDAGGRSYRGAAYLFTQGPWTRELLSGYRIPLKTTRQQFLYLRPPENQGRFRPGHMPIFSSSKRGLRGLPVHIHGFMKLELQRKGPPEKPIPREQPLSPQFEKTCRVFLKEFLPDLAGFRDKEGKVCYYDHSPDGDFIVDRLPKCPNAVVAAGFAGRGFTFAPLVGSWLADLALDKKPEANLTRFRISRFR